MCGFDSRPGHRRRHGRARIVGVVDSVGIEQQVADQAREVGRGWSGADADPDWALVGALFDALADDEVLSGLAAEIPMERLPALVFVASIQRVVADHTDDALAAYYPGPHQRPIDERFPATLRRFAIARQDELRRWFDRRYQMNEVGRCVQTALAVGVVARLAAGRPLAVIDVGTGSGIGLHFDRYRVDLDSGLTFGPADSTVRLTCEVRGDPPLPEIIEVAWRIGIDAAPIDLDDDDARAWLAACCPPTVHAFERLDAAIAVTRDAAVPTIRGEGGAVLAQALGSVPEGALPVVLDSFTAVFMDDAERAAIAAAVGQRDGFWISLDPLVPLGTTADRCVHDLPVDPQLVADNRAGGVFALLSIVGSIDGRRIERVLGTAHSSGTRMTWFD